MAELGGSGAMLMTETASRVCGASCPPGLEGTKIPHRFRLTLCFNVFVRHAQRFCTTRLYWRATRLYEVLRLPIF